MKIIINDAIITLENVPMICVILSESDKENIKNMGQENTFYIAYDPKKIKAEDVKNRVEEIKKILKNQPK